MRCASHVGCKREHRVMLDSVRRCLVFSRRGEHSGADMQISGFAVQQWKVLAVSESQTAIALALELNAAGCPKHDKRVLVSYLGLGENPKATLRVMMTRGSLLQWAISRSRANLEATGKLMPYTLIVVKYAGLDGPGGVLQILFTMERWMEKAGRLEVCIPRSVELFTDGTHKLTERRILASELQDSDDEAAPKTSRAEARRKLKNNALLCIAHGYQSSHYTNGSVEGRSGGIRKHRFSYNPLTFAMRHAGEHTVSSESTISGAVEYAEQYHPRVAEKL